MESTKAFDEFETHTRQASSDYESAALTTTPPCVYIIRLTRYEEGCLKSY